MPFGVGAGPARRDGTSFSAGNISRDFRVPVGAAARVPSDITLDALRIGMNGYGGGMAISTPVPTTTLISHPSTRPVGPVSVQAPFAAPFSDTTSGTTQAYQGVLGAGVHPNLIPQNYQPSQDPTMGAERPSQKTEVLKGDALFQKVLRETPSLLSATEGASAGQPLVAPPRSESEQVVTSGGQEVKQMIPLKAPQVEDSGVDISLAPAPITFHSAPSKTREKSNSEDSENSSRHTSKASSKGSRRSKRSQRSNQSKHSHASDGQSKRSHASEAPSERSHAQLSQRSQSYATASEHTQSPQLRSHDMSHDRSHDTSHDQEQEVPPNMKSPEAEEIKSMESVRYEDSFEKSASEISEITEESIREISERLGTSLSPPPEVATDSEHDDF